MRRISLAVALVGAMAAAGCGGGAKPSAKNGAPGTLGSTFTLEVRVEGVGTVVSTPSGINCAGPATCSADFNYGTEVALAATPGQAGNPLTTQHFNGFFGACSGYACALTGNAEKYVVAYFSAQAEAHPNFNDPRVHGPARTSGALVCEQCHGANLQGVGLAVACSSCHNPPAAPATFVERCKTCHTSLATTHALADQLGVQVGNAQVSVSGSNVVITFNVKVNGVTRNDFLRKASEVRNHNEDAWWVYNTNVNDVLYTQPAPNNFGPAGIRTKLPFVAGPSGGTGSSTAFSLASNGNGNYTATLAGLPAGALAPGATFMLSTMAGTTGFGTTATVVATLGARAHDVVADRACINCHGQLVWRDAVHDVTFPQGVGPCIVCHSRSGSADPRLPGAGSGLMGIVHGIHNSHNMPDRTYTFTWYSNGNQFPFSIGFPGYMQNCSSCHDTAARLNVIKAAPVSYALCISCHDSWAGFPAVPAGHLVYTNTSGENCTAAACHDGTAAPATMTGFHNGLFTERAGLIYGGADQAVAQGKRVDLSINDVSYAAGKLVVKWAATLDGAPVNPCNTNVESGPVFVGLYTSTSTLPSGGSVNVTAADQANGLTASNMSILQAYAQGNDWVNAGNGTSPGQPASAPTLQLVSATSNGYTTCAANVATTVLNVPTLSGSPAMGAVALQGKPQLKFTDGTYFRYIQVRAETPVREFVVGTGAFPATPRRQVVSNEKCLACHPGSLYQHGGNRIDNVALCVMCHDPAANESNNRAGMGVDATEAYDGKVGETYDMRYMVHAIHSAGETGMPLAYYRSNGVYFFGTAAALAASTHWPSTGGISCKNAEGATVTYYKVYGSIATGTVPEANPDGTCKTTGLANSADGTWRVHNFIEVHYPRPLSDCSACHVGGTETGVPDQPNKMAVTLDAGASSPVQTDDVLIGAAAASCMSCHQSGTPATQTQLRDHAYGYGWIPGTFANGRATLINWAKCGAATCP